MRTLISIFTMMSFFCSQLVFARGVDMNNSITNPAIPNAAPVTADQTTTPNIQPIVTPVMVPPNETLQSLARRSQQNNNKGAMLGMAAIGAMSAGVAMTCFTTHPNPKCPWFVGGLIASIVVTANMNKAKGQSFDTDAAVTVEGSGSIPVGGQPLAGDPSAPPLPNWEDDPNWKAAQKTLAKLKENGWKINTETGNFTSPSGKTMNASVTKSASSMRAAGASEADIEAFQSAMNQAAAKVANEKPSQTADKMGNLFGDGAVGGGGSGSKSSSGGADSYGSYAPPSEAGPKLGIDRDPAQVAGMKKIFNGEPIGVSADSAFNMIQRRYDLHEKNGSFLPGR